MTWPTAKAAICRLLLKSSVAAWPRIASSSPTAADVNEAVAVQPTCCRSERL